MKGRDNLEETFPFSILTMINTHQSGHYEMDPGEQYAVCSWANIFMEVGVSSMTRENLSQTRKSGKKDWLPPFLGRVWQQGEFHGAVDSEIQITSDLQKPPVPIRSTNSKGGENKTKSLDEISSGYQTPESEIRADLKSKICVVLVFKGSGFLFSLSLRKTTNFSHRNMLGRGILLQGE